MSTAQAKLDSAFDRLDAIINRRVREEEAALTRDDAARADAARVKASRDSERRVEIASRYAPAFLAHNVEVPMPLDDERPVDFATGCLIAFGTVCRRRANGRPPEPTN